MLENLEQIPEMEIVGYIYGLGDVICWETMHDTGPKKPFDINDAMKQNTQVGNELLKELKRRTGITSDGAIWQYFLTKLDELNKLWDKQWEEIYREGSVFTVSGKGIHLAGPEVYETVRTYLSTHAKTRQIVLTRVQGTKELKPFNDAEIPELVKQDKPTLYTAVSPEKRGIIKIDEETAKRIVAQYGTTRGKNWRKYTQEGAVFRHEGFDETFETFRLFNLPNTEIDRENLVVLAKSYDRPLFAEFSTKDLGAMYLVSKEPMYTRTVGNTVYLPELKL